VRENCHAPGHYRLSSPGIFLWLMAGAIMSKLAGAKHSRRYFPCAFFDKTDESPTWLPASSATSTACLHISLYIFTSQRYIGWNGAIAYAFSLNARTNLDLPCFFQSIPAAILRGPQTIVAYSYGCTLHVEKPLLITSSPEASKGKKWFIRIIALALLSL
jgi:hypothetical protein